MGVFAESWVPKMAGALDALDCEAGLVAHGVIGPASGIDELTTATLNRVRGAGRLRAIDTTWSAGDFGLPVAPFAELQGGDLATNLALTEAILDGRGPAGLVETIALNAAVGMWLTGKVASVAEGIAPARGLLLGGAVKAKIAATREFYRA
jgi:anthranilate phosphoribosyltransferase